jgi:hypothetical protein
MLSIRYDHLLPLKVEDHKSDLRSWNQRFTTMEKTLD